MCRGQKLDARRDQHAITDGDPVAVEENAVRVDEAPADVEMDAVVARERRLDPAISGLAQQGAERRDPRGSVASRGVVKGIEPDAGLADKAHQLRIGRKVDIAGQHFFTLGTSVGHFGFPGIGSVAFGRDRLRFRVADRKQAD